ncbi:hypothetical protein LDENG_00173030 [Lucifuga dentata]|nr:hypothetical protein LDENG_00173030 [Lucifuga dentata]
MAGCCITNRHGITQISVITKETRTNSQQPSHLLIRPANKQKCRKTQITQSDSTGFSTDSSHIKVHQTYQSCSSSEDEVHPPFFLYKEFNDMAVQYIGAFQFQNPLCIKKQQD